MGGLSILAGLHAAGWQVGLWTPDIHDQRRGRDMLSQAGLDVPVHMDRPTHSTVLIEAGDLPEVASHQIVILTSSHPTTHARRFGLCRVPGTRLLDLRLDDPDLWPLAKRVAQDLGYAYIETRGTGFVSEDVRLAMLGAADALLLDGASPSEIDEAMEAAGYAIGPYELDDLAGISDRPTGPVRDRTRAEGRLGKAHGWGWYRYPGGGGKVVDPLIEDLIAEEAHFANHAQRSVAPSQIVTTLSTALALASRLSLAKARISETDLFRLQVAILGKSFPDHGFET